MSRPKLLDLFACEGGASVGYQRAGSKEVVKALLGVEHDMTWNGLFECVPPAYAEHVGRQLLAHIESERAA